MNTLINIQPVQFFPFQATAVQISDIYINLQNQTANCQYTFVQSGGQSINSSAARWNMDSGTYAQWNASDQYFINACISGLGLTAV